MIGVDLGFTVGCVMSIKGKMPLASGVIKPEKIEGENELDRVARVANHYALHIKGYPDKFIAVEEPMYSWGRKNPKGFAKNVALFTLVCYLIKQQKREVIVINNKTAKMVAGHGNKDKEGMIKAYIEAVGTEPAGPQYAKETRADAYWIARAGKLKLKENK